MIRGFLFASFPTDFISWPSFTLFLFISLSLCISSLALVCSPRSLVSFDELPLCFYIYTDINKMSAPEHTKIMEKLSIVYVRVCVYVCFFCVGLTPNWWCYLLIYHLIHNIPERFFYALGRLHTSSFSFFIMNLWHTKTWPEHWGCVLLYATKKTEIIKYMQ